MRHHLSEYAVNFEWKTERVRLDLSILLIVRIYGKQRAILRLLSKLQSRMPTFLPRAVTN